MRVLVTGGGGFLGSWICRQLLARGDSVVALQRSPAPQLEREGARVVQADLADRDRLAGAMRDCDAVVHTAARAGAWGPAQAFHAANVLGTENVLWACREAAVPRLVFTSSPSVVHAGGDIEGGDESLPYPGKYEAYYPATKARAEQLVLAANGPGLHTAALRPHLVWGPGDNHLLPRLLQRSERGVIRLPGTTRLVDTVYVENAAAAHLQAIDALAANPACRGRAFFISNGEPLEQGEVIQRLLAAAGRTVRISQIPPWLARAAGGACELAWTLLRREGEPPVTRWTAAQLATAHWYDISAARRELAWRPEVSIETGLEHLRRHLQTVTD